MLTWCVRLALVIMVLTVAPLGRAAAQDRFDLNIPAAPVAEAVKSLSLQTGRSALFQTDDVDAVRTNAVVGRYSLREALDALLAGTPLTGGLTESGVITIALADTTGREEGDVTRGLRGSLLASVSALLFSAGGAHAQDDVDEASANGRDVIVVTATKRESDIQDTAMSITALGEETIERRNLFGMEDYLATVPGVGFTSQGPGFNGIVIRGVSVNPERDGETSGPVTGVYFGETPIAGFGHAGGSADVALVDMERVEVLRGPQGTLYGAGAMGGVVRQIPNAPDLSEAFARVSLGYSSTGGYGGDNSDVRAVANLPLITDQLAVRGVFYTTSDSGYYKNISAVDPALESFREDQGAVGDINEDVGAIDYLGGRLAVLWEPTADLALELSYLNQNIDQDGWGQADFALGNGYEQSRTLVRIGSSNATASPPENHAGLEDDLEIAQAKITYATPWGDLVSATSWVQEENLLLRYIAFSGSPFSQSITFGGDSVVEELRFSSNFAGPLNVVLGGYYEDRDFNDVYLTVHGGDNDLIPDSLSFRESVLTHARPSTHVALFGEATFDLTEKITFTGGARWFDQERTVAQYLSINLADPTLTEFEASESDTLYKAGVDFKPTDNLMLFATYSEGFRLGDVRPPNTVPACDADDDGFYDAYPNVSTNASPIESDRLDNYEIGGKLTGADRRLRINATAYHIDWTGIPISATMPCGVSVTLNAGEAESEGVELETSYAFDNGLYLGASATYVDAQLLGDFEGLGAAGDRLPGQPEHSFSVNGGYDFLLGGNEAYVSAVYTYVGAFHTALGAMGQEAGDYGRLDLDAGLQIDDFNLSVFADNVTDEDAVASVYSTLGGISGTRLRPRTVGVKLGYEF